MTLLERARAIAADRDAGGSELLARSLPLLADAIIAGRAATLDVVRVILRGQPAMAPLWHACAAAVADGDAPGSFARRRAEMERARRTLVRAASAALGDLFTDDPSPRVLTLSYSGSVADTLAVVARRTALRVVCGEGRPRFEGRRLAKALHEAGADVTVVVDAALTVRLCDASAVVMGADAVFPERWVNKIGSFGLAAAASLSGTPVYVVAARDKFVPAALASRMRPVEGPAAEVWPDAPQGTAQANPYFESVPSDLATLFLTEAGPIAPSDVPALTDRRLDDFAELATHLD